jgi:hypothetical protein
MKKNLKTVVVAIGLILLSVSVLAQESGVIVPPPPLGFAEITRLFSAYIAVNEVASAEIKRHNIRTICGD